MLLKVSHHQKPGFLSNRVNNFHSPEIILQLPPNSKILTQSHIEVIPNKLIFTEGDISIELTPEVSKFFSTTITNENGQISHLHCLITYECITPEIIQKSKDRISSLSDLEFLYDADSVEEEFTSNFYVPVVLCLVTKSNYIDLFREILESLYNFLIDIRVAEVDENSLIASIEFMRTVCMLLNDLIIPPYDTQLTLKVGGNEIIVPIEESSGLPHAEKCIAVLIDLIDIRNIIEVWESLLMNNHVILMSCNEYLLYLILEALKDLLFPLKWSLCIIPVVGRKLLEILSCPVPILIGLNSTQISLEEAIAESPGALILDIDTNIIYSKEPSMLCHCQKEIISKKLQLVKAYYYVSHERLSIYRMNSLEANVNDKEFIMTARLLLNADNEESEGIFISLIKEIFLSFFISGLGKIPKCTLYDSFKEKFEFSREMFLSFVQLCSSCQMYEFWNKFIESASFDGFLEYHGKLDDSYYKRFFEIIERKRKGMHDIFNSNCFFRINISRCLPARDLLEAIRNDLSSKNDSFVNESIRCIWNEIRDLLRPYQEYYRSGESIGHYESKKHLLRILSDNINIKHADNLFYGSFGIIRLTSLMLSHMTEEHFKSLSLVNQHIIPSLEQIPNSSVNYFSALSILLFYNIKPEKTQWNLEEIKNILIDMNKSKIPSYLYQPLCSIIAHIIQIKPLAARELVKHHGKLSFLTKLVSTEAFTPSPSPQQLTSENLTFQELASIHEVNHILNANSAENLEIKIPMRRNKRALTSIK